MNAPTVEGTRIALHRVSHIILALLLFLVGGLLGLYVLLGAKGPADCAYTINYLPDYRFFFVGGFSLLAGRLLGRIDPRPAPRPTVGSRRMGHAALVFVFILNVVIWFAEALGTARVSVGAASAASTVTTAVFEPITFYIRCAMYHDISSISGGLLSGIVIFIVCAVMGHWLWGKE